MKDKTVAVVPREYRQAVIEAAMGYVVCTDCAGADRAPFAPLYGVLMVNESDLREDWAILCPPTCKSCGRVYNPDTRRWRKGGKA